MQTYANLSNLEDLTYANLSSLEDLGKLFQVTWTIVRGPQEASGFDPARWLPTPQERRRPLFLGGAGAGFHTCGAAMGPGFFFSAWFHWDLAEGICFFRIASRASC